MKHFNSIRDFVAQYKVDVPQSLFSIHRFEDVAAEDVVRHEKMSFNFFKISFVRSFNGSINIGGNRFEGENGVLYFVRPQEVYTCNSSNPWEGFEILLHPDVFEKNVFAREMSSYRFFSYKVNESLLLSPNEEQAIDQLMELAWNEFQNNKDEYSTLILLSYVSTLMNLAERYYARQFTDREILSNQLTRDFYHLLNNYYSSQDPVAQPTVTYFADKLNVTPNYLSDTLRHHSGHSALSEIQDFVIRMAKKRLTETSLSVSEISFHLGFEYPNYFSRLFKRKTELSPSQYRKSVKSL